MLPLAIALIARLRSQLNHVFALLIVMPECFKSINYYFNRPKIKLCYLCQKRLQNFPNVKALPPDF